MLLLWLLIMSHSTHDITPRRCTSSGTATVGVAPSASEEGADDVAAHVIAQLVPDTDMAARVAAWARDPRPKQREGGQQDGRGFEERKESEPGSEPGH